MTGTLYLCATPIGNLEDITFRVLRTLKEVDLIAAEDTRNSIKLLNHFEIKTPMTSYHEFNKIDKAYQLVAKLKEGKNIALITDAGTPGISDPGEDIVRICYEEGVPVTSLPGAAACITALTMSGRPTRRFAFEAFLPRDKKERARVIEELKKENERLRGLLEYSGSFGECSGVAASVTGRSTDIYFRVFTVNAGRNQGIDVDMPVICADGLSAGLRRSAQHGAKSRL